MVISFGEFICEGKMRDGVGQVCCVFIVSNKKQLHAPECGKEIFTALLASQYRMQSTKTRRGWKREYQWAM